MGRTTTLIDISAMPRHETDNAYLGDYPAVDKEGKSFYFRPRQGGGYGRPSWMWIILVLSGMFLGMGSANSNVQNASMATPPTTNTLASDHFGFSKTIPPATAKLARIAVVNNTTWGNSGSKEPEKNPLIWLYLAAAGSWLSVALIAVAKWFWVRRKH